MAASPCRISVANVLEASILVERRGGDTAAHEFDTLLESAEIELVPVTVEYLWKQRAVYGAASARAITRRH